MARQNAIAITTHNTHTSQQPITQERARYHCATGSQITTPPTQSGCTYSALAVYTVPLTVAPSRDYSSPRIRANASYTWRTAFLRRRLQQCAGHL